MKVPTSLAPELAIEGWRGRGLTTTATLGLRLFPAPMLAATIAGVAGVAVALTSLLALVSTGAVLAGFHLLSSGTRFGFANTATLVRLNLAAFLLAVAITTLWFAEPAALPLLWIVFTVAAVALVLDGVDGWLARRRREVSDFGSRMDMAADTAFTIITTLCLVSFGLVGAWVLLIGLMRPAFVAAAWIWPALSSPLPESRGRKIACGGSLGCLVAGLAPPLAALAPALALLALLQLVWSFGRDLRYLLGREAAA